MNADWLIYVGIPLGAAIIGYVTNWVAIRMLFRPHTEKRLFGVKVPFTPGVIPARRAEMAERMGAAVARHLITEDSIAARIDTPEVRGHLEQLVSGYLDEWLDRELGPLESLIPEEFRREWEDALKALQDRIREEIARVLRDARTEASVRQRIHAHVEDLWERPLKDILPESLWSELPERLGDALARLAHDEAFEARVRAFLDERIDALLQDERPLRAYLPPKLQEAAYEKLGELLPLMLEKLAAVLEDEGLKKRIKLQLYELADKLLTDTFREDSLWDQLKFGLLETFVISVDELKEKVDRAVDEAAPKLAALLQREDVQARVYRSLIRAADTLLDKRLADFRLPPEAVEQLKERLTQAVVAGARSPETRKQIVAFLRRRLEEIQGRPLREVLPGWPPERLAPQLGDWALHLLRRDETIDALAEFLAERLKKLAKQPIGPLRDHVPTELAEKAKRWLSQQAIEMLKRETPKMVQAIDVQHVVREQVDKLAIGEVEQLILAITSRQLRAITWFGALLGFLIGLLQVGVLLARGGL